MNSFPRRNVREDLGAGQCDPDPRGRDAGLPEIREGRHHSLVT